MSNLPIVNCIKLLIIMRSKPSIKTPIIHLMLSLKVIFSNTLAMHCHCINRRLLSNRLIIPSNKLWSHLFLILIVLYWLNLHHLLLLLLLQLLLLLLLLLLLYIIHLYIWLSPLLRLHIHWRLRLLITHIVNIAILIPYKSVLRHIIGILNYLKRSLRAYDLTLKSILHLWISLIVFVTVTIKYLNARLIKSTWCWLLILS